MNIYTGNFGNIKKYQQAGIFPVSIARFNRYFSGAKLMDLAPYPNMLKMSEEEYTPMFKQEMLGKITAEEVVQKLKELSGGKDVVLLCYEKVGDFCHRHLVADWLKKELKIEVLELGKMEQPPQPEKTSPDVAATFF